MKYFTQLHDLPIYDLYAEMSELLAAGFISWKNNQICINTTKQHPLDIHLGVGSLWYDWDNAKQITDEHGVSRLHVPERDIPMKEADFDTLAGQFVGTLFEDVYLSVTSKFNIGRMRIMKSEPKTCLTWHVDDTKRIHYPMLAQDGALMVIEDEVKFLPQNSWWLTDTLRPHTAFNGGAGSRIHLVTEMISER
jgi:hypothetical protein